MKVISWYKNERQLIDLLRKQDRKAQQYVYKEYAPKMLGVCRQYIRDLHHAEDVLLQGFLKVFKQVDSFRNHGSFEGWIRRIMIHESISFLRKTHKLEFVDSPIEDSTSMAPEETPLDVSHIQQLIDALPAGYRAVFVLYAVEGYKHIEIAEKLEISIATSKSQLFKARKLLQKQWKAQSKESYGTT